MSKINYEKYKMSEIIPNNQRQKTTELTEKYRQERIDFLDNLQPDDFRNGGSFNQAEIIIEELNKALYRAALNKENTTDFMTKAAKNLFRENSPAVEKVINLANIYLAMRFDNIPN